MQKADSPVPGERAETAVSRRAIIVLLAVLAAVALVAAGASVHSNAALRESSAQWVASVLDPTAALLRENQQIIRELKAPPFVERGNGILESYLLRIRRDGVPKNAEMKQRLDQLEENNTAIVTLIKVYLPHARTGAFITSSDNFRTYASAWRDRWSSVMEIFMSGGDYAAAAIPFPPDIAAAVADEATASR
jgi:hypothetical protein